MEANWRLISPIEVAISTVNIVAEGSTDLPALRRCIEYAGLSVGNFVISTGGKHGFNARLGKYLAAAQIPSAGGWLLVRDLDHDAACAPELVSSLLAQHHLARQPQNGRLRIAVREIEAWALADDVGFSRHYGVSRDQLPTNPDTLADPKQTIVKLARRSSKRTIASGVPPTPSGGRSVGPSFETELNDFFLGAWEPERAASRSDSLFRAIESIRSMGA